jgi:hypothetical protein
VAEATPAATFAVLEIELDVETEVAVAVACDPSVAPTDSDELILRIELADPSLLTDPTADADELAEETGGVVPFWAVDVFVEAIAPPLISPPASATGVNVIPAASVALDSSRGASFELWENAAAVLPEIDGDEWA